MKFKEIFTSLAEIYNKTTEKTAETVIILRDFSNASTILVPSAIDKELENSPNSIYKIKIPNQYKIGTSVIWDCYCLETTNPTQGLINKFFIKRLSETTEKLKFIILTSESSIIKRNNEFSSIIESFANIFILPKPEELKDSLALMITKAKAGSELNKLYESLKNISQENKTIKEFFNNLSFLDNRLLPAFIKIFPKHSQLEFSTVESIIKNLNAVKVNINHFPLKLKTYEEAGDLWFKIKYNVAAINDIITQTFNKENFDYYRPLNCHIFFDNYDNHIKKFLLTSNKNYTSLFPKNTKHFQGLQQIFEFCNLIKEVNADSKTAIIELLNIIEKFVAIPQQQEQIHNYSYIFKQQTEYILFFEEVLTQSFLGYLFTKVINRCKETVNEIFMPFIENIKLTDSKDISYYKQAIEWLDKYETPKDITETKALAYFNIGKILSEAGELIPAWLNFNNALKFNEKSTSIYIEIGNILLKLGHEELAIQYFKVASQPSKILQCFDSLIRKNPSDIKPYIQKGDFLFEQHDPNEALKLYTYAKDIAANKAQRSEVTLKTLKFWISGKKPSTDIIKYSDISANDRDNDFNKIVGENYMEVNHAGDNYEYIN